MFSRENTEKLVKILRQPLYLGIAVSGSLLGYFIYALSFNFGILSSSLFSGNFSLLIGLIPPLITGFPNTVPVYSLILAILISLAIGVNFALAAYSFLSSRNLESSSGSVLGLAGSTLAPACTACATGAIGFAGFSTSLALLPFEGVEITVGVLVMLVASSFWILEKSKSDKCLV